eukprot:14305637-Ditylum_brightwellii.AAC.1
MLAPAVNWYSDLYSCFQMCTTVAVIEQGEDIYSKTLSVGRHITIEITRYLLKQDKSECYESWTELAMLRQAVGRG